jgi:tetratricopeptide (TPR) repeat protein
MMRIFVVLFFMLTVLVQSNAEEFDARSVFEHANQLYINKDYTEAVKEYRKLIDNGYESADIFFNLANSYYRLRKTPEAIYYYEKAKKLNPDDDDINFNLNVANLRVVDKFKSIPKFFLTEWYENTVNMFSSNTWAIWALISVWAAMILLVAFLFVWNLKLKKSLFAGAILMIIVFVFSLFFTFDRMGKENAKNEAIIFSASVYVKSSPDDKSTDLFILHEGTKVKIKDKIGNWLEIMLPNGSVGWMPEKDLKII